RQRRPVAYQWIGGRRVPVRASFGLHGRRVGFHLGDYDARYPLVIDPQLVFTTYLGGTGTDTTTRIAAASVGGSTSVFVGGKTRSPSFQGSNAHAGTAGSNDDAFISRLSADGSTVLATTFVGGVDHDDRLTGLATGNGHVFVAGSTDSSDMPTGIGLGTPLKATYSAGDSW